MLIKGLVHSSSEYLVTGKAAQPAGDRALFLTSCLLAPLCTASSWAVMGTETREPSGHQEPRGMGHWGVAPAGRMLFAALLGPMSAQGCCRTQSLACSAEPALPGADVAPAAPSASLLLRCPCLVLQAGAEHKGAESFAGEKRKCWALGFSFCFDCFVADHNLHSLRLVFYFPFR